MTIVEVVEHIDAERLDMFAQVVLGEAAPATVIVTTPNREYNVHFEGVGETELRHGDHRFEWTRHQFASWAAEVGGRHGYAVTHSGIGPDDPVTGPPTQMVVFSR